MRNLAIELALFFHDNRIKGNNQHVDISQESEVMAEEPV
jgi:hypothetical protein